MTKITKSEQNNKSEKFERFVALNNGEFWQAKKSDESRAIEEGEILMIAQIDYVDNTPHTIHVRLHPSKVRSYATTVKFLVEEFITNFEFVEQEVAEASRKAEIEKIQGRIQEEQDEMQRAYADPKLLDKLVEEELPKKETSGEAGLPARLETFGADIVGAVKTQNLTALMSKGLTENGLEQIRSGLEGQKDIALRRSEWIQMRTKRLTQISAEMTPFFEEKAALPLAMSKEMMDHVDNLMKGIGNLNLYVLKNVDIDRIREGVSAPSEMKLSVTQRVLYMDEEMGVWADLSDDFDFRSEDEFFDALRKSDGLVNQMFPTERCVVSIAATRKNHEYEGYSSYERNRMHAENRRQFLLVRDGGNIYVVLSPELFHNYSQTTFPTTGETEGVFRGLDGRRITYRDLDYTRQLAAHERIALGYKRLLILLCGLDHNKKLFGDFYVGEPSLDFVSMEFQEKYFNFIHDVDGEGMLPSYRPEAVTQWAEKMNEEISFGSRVLVRWRKVFTEENCPSVYERENRFNIGYDRTRSIQYTPTEGAVVYGVISKRGSDMVMKIEVSGERLSDYQTRTFEAVFNVSMALKYASPFDILCVDRLNPKDARWYLHDRPSRNINLDNILMLKQALSHADALRKEESELREALNDAMNASGLFEDIEALERIVDHAIAKWRCANPRKEISSIVEDKKAFNLLCDQIYMLAGKGRNPEDEIKASEKERGREVLRISLQPNGKYVAYSTPLESERDDRVYDFTWVVKTPYSLLKKGAKALKPSFAHIGKVNNAETVVFESESIDEYVVPEDAPFETVNKKVAFIERIQDSNAQLKELLRIKGTSDRDAILQWIAKYEDLRDDLTFTGKSSGVKEPYLDLALGATAKDGNPLFIGVKRPVFEILAWLVAGNEVLEFKLSEAFQSAYLHQDKAKDRIQKNIEICKGKSFFQCFGLQYAYNVRLGMHAQENDYYFHISEVEGYNYSLQKRLESAFKESKKVWLVDSTLETLDEDYGATRPDDFEPLIVVKKGFIEDKGLDVFEFTDETMASLKGHERKVVANEKELEDGYRFTFYTTDDGKAKGSERKRVKVTLEWSEVKPREVDGKVALRSYEYKEVRREPSTW